MSNEPRRRRLALTLVGYLLLVAGCAPRERIVSVNQLESAASAPGECWYVRVADPAALATRGEAFGRRVGLVEIRNARDWARLAEASPGIGPCPDFRRGIVAGLVYFGGTPVDGGWPLEIECVRVFEGAALLEARFNGGSFLADGVGYAHLAHVEGLRAVVMVEIDGNRYYPPQ